MEQQNTIYKHKIIKSYITLKPTPNLWDKKSIFKSWKLTIHPCFYYRYEGYTRNGKEEQIYSVVDDSGSEVGNIVVFFMFNPKKICNCYLFRRESTDMFIIRCIYNHFFSEFLAKKYQLVHPTVDDYLFEL